MITKVCSGRPRFCLVRYLEEIGVPYEQIDALSTNRQAASYPHPFGSIPAASDGDTALFESGAILLYIADKYGGLDTPEKRAAVTKWVVWANASLDPICFIENERGQVLDTKLSGSPRAIGILDSLLGKSEWLLGSEFSVADVAVSSYLLYALMFFPGLRLKPKWPNVAKYCHAAASRPAYAAAFGTATARSLAQRAIS